MVNVDKDASYPVAFADMKKEGMFKKTKLRTVKYLNNVIEQDHRSVKRQHRQAMGYKSLETARNTIEGIESINMAFKGQIDSLPDTNTSTIKKFIEELFEVQSLAA